MKEYEREIPPTSRYSAYLDRLPHQATAEDFEKWAREHPEDSCAAEALIDAGWEWSVDGEYVRALALFSEALNMDPAHAGPARVGMADQLCKLHRREEAREVLAELRAELEASEQPDLEMYAEAAGLLEECGEFGQAAEWCEAGLAHSAEQAPPERQRPISGLTLRGRLLISRRAARRELGLPADVWDEEAVIAEERGLETFRALRREPPDDHQVFDGIIVYWPADTFSDIVSRWPRSRGSGHSGCGGYDGYGEDHDAYRRSVQREAQQHTAADTPHVILVCGNAEGYADYAARAGMDPARPETLRAYGAWRHLEHPELSVRWPPPLHAPCWCGSGREYKECCGASPPDRTPDEVPQRSARGAPG